MSNSKSSSESNHYKNEIQRLERLFESSSLHYQSLDAEGILVKVNAAWLNTMGYNEDEIIHRWFGDFLSEDSRKRFSRSYKDLLKNRIKKEIELTLTCKDGSKLFAEFICNGNFDKSGALINTHCIFKNITKLRLTEQALKESEKKYSQLVELSNVGIFEFDLGTRKFTYLNEVIKRELGIKDEDVGHFDIEDFLSDEDKILYHERMNKLLNGENIPNVVEFQITNSKGRNIWGQTTNSYILDDQKRIRIIGVAQDITARKQLELELESYYSTLQQITNNIPAVIFQYKIENNESSFVYVSRNIEQYTGYTEQQIIKDPSLVTKLIDQKDFKGLSALIDTALEKGEPAHLTYRVTKLDGTRSWTKTILSPKVLNNGTTLWTGICSDITSEMELKEKLQFSELRYKALVNSAASGISTMAKNGIILTVNPRLCEISGYREEELVGKHFLKIPAFYTKDAAKYITLYKNALKGIIPSEPVQFEWKQKNGEKRWGEAFLGVLLQNDKPVGYQSVLTDITNRVLLEKKEKQREKEINFLFESAVKLLNIENEKDLFSFIATQAQKLIPGSIVEVNSISEEGDTLRIEAIRFPDRSKYTKVMRLLENSLTGRTFSVNKSTFNYTITGKLERYHDSIYELALRQVPKVVCDQIEKVIDLGSIHEISLGTRDRILGGCAFFLKKGQEIKNAGIIETLFREASSALVRLRTAKGLDRSEKLYRSLAESSGEWIIRFNKEFQHIYVNYAVIKAFNKNTDEFLGKTCSKMGFSKEHTKLIENQLSKTIVENKPSQCDIELTIGGKSDFYEWHFYPESSEKGVVESVLVNARNITRRKEMEGRLLEAVSKKNKLYSIISHDLRSPFNSIIGFLNLLKDRYPKLSDEERLKYINIIEESSQNCLSLFNSILQWSSEYETAESIKPVFFDLSLLVQKVIDLNNAAILENELKIFNEVTNGIIVIADYNMIFTVIRNLFTNAMKFSKNGGAIILSALDQKNNILCKIQDFGIGMSEENVEKILRKNVRITTTGTNGITGFGLGLKLSKEFVENNNGRLWIESKPGKGTTVFFTLEK
ncbi:MAG: PAS domain S-box protein [Bacteroidales bacterium]|nr:PAS domain S-box protein [Bacteroidales bacterium]